MSKIAPSDFTALTAGKWESVLESHYLSTQRIAQGLGAIDPTAVCTTKVRTEALSEQVIGAIHIDQLFAGEDIELNPGLTNEDLIWNARSDIPFIMVDNPMANQVFVDRLVGLPEDRLYIEQDGRFGVDGIFCGN